MNKIYKVIWSKVRNCYVAVSEIAKRNGKSCTSVNCGAKVNRGRAGVALSAAVGATLLAGVCSVLLPVRVALAAPVMPTLDFKGDPIKAASPYVTINSTTSDTTATMNISSTQTNNVLKWIDFSIGKGGTVQFDPNNYLNYVTGHGRSEIDGTLTGAGNIYLINPNGILFGSNASVNVGNLYLSTRSLTAAQLNEFANNGTNPLGTTASSAAGDIINLGRLNANNITVEGNNISFKNVEEVTPATAVNVRASGEVHVGFANDAAAATTINSTEYQEVHNPTLTNWNFKGLDNETSVTPVKYMLVRNAYELQNINNNLTGNYMLANDIEFKNDSNELIIKNFKSLGSKGNNWGSRPGMFQGRLDGLNHVIRNINITNTNNESYTTDVGLIGSNAGIVENFGVVNGKIVLSSKSWVGGIVGANKACGIIRNVFFSGLVEGSSNVGGIAGAQDVKNTQDGVPLPGGIIEKAYVSGTVSSNKGSNVGGIAGSNASGARISEAYNSANVRIITGGNYTGGIAGTNSGTIINTYNTGTIEGGTYVGGIAGSNSSNGSIQNTYNTGTVSGTSNLGGIVGYNSGTSPISSFFTKGNDNGKGTLISDESKLKEFATFDGTSLASNMSKTGGDGKVWRIYEGQTGPLLTAFLKTKDVITETEYNGTAQTFDKNLVKGDSHITAIDDGGYATETNAGKYGGLTEGKVLYSDQLGYNLVDTKLIIQPKKLTATFGSNTYNGTAVFTGVSGTLTGVVDGDVGKVSVTATATYVDKNVGEGKAVAYSDIELSGDAVLEEAKYNYMIVKSLTGTGEITAKTLNLVSVSKEYDGTKDVEAVDIGITEADKITGDDVNLAAGKVTGLYADKNVGTGKDVTYTVNTGALTGTDAGNYIISIAGTGEITAKTLNLVSVSKEYDGTKDVEAVDIGITEADKITGDDVNLAAGKVTGLYADKNVGTSKDVTYTVNTGALTGTDAGNYIISTAGTGEITAKTLNLVSVSKEYDGTKDVEAGDIGITEADKVTGDDVNLAAGKVTGLYADKNVGTGKGVTYTVSTGALTGNDAGNYIISTAGTGDITAKAITATFSDISRVYDGGVTAIENGKQLNDVVSGDDVSFATGITGAFADKNVGTNKTVTYSGISLTGNDKNNYSIAETATGKGTITAKAITATFSDISRVYDGGVTATENGKQLNDVVSGDDVGFATGITGAFADKNVGTNKTVTYSGIVLTGNDKNNYSIAETATGKGTITAKAITATFSDISRVYDGGVTATENGKQLNDVVSGDDVSFATGITGAFADKNVGTNKTVTYSGISLTGNDKNNYSIAETATGKGTITAKAITATFSDISRVYDGGVTAIENGKQLNDVVSGDDVGFATGITGAFADKNVGTNKTVTYSGIVLTGNDKNNYSIAETATGKGTITAKAITATFSDISRVYDGGVTATENGKQLNDVVSGDDVSFATGITGAFADKNVGTNKTVTYSGIVLTGNDKNNYSIAETATGKGTITAKAITATFSDISRVYDGGVTATENGKQLNDVVSGDDVSFATGITGAFADKNVGTNKTVTYSGIVLTGNDKNNYSIAETATGKGTITAKAITATFSDISRVYDGGVTATENGKQLNDVVSGDDVGFATGITGAFADKNVGTNKTVTYSGIVLTGNDKNNYSIAETATGKGTITAKAITATFSDISRVYDGGVTATENGKQLNDVVSGDDVSFATGITGAFADKNVGTNKTVTYSGISLTGNDKNNYSIAASATGKGTITAKAITATFSDISRVYDGGVTATENGKQLNDVVSGDDVSFATGITGAFADKNVGTNKTVTYSGISLTGNDKNNYSIAETATGKGTITAKAITATFSEISRVYDGGVTATENGKQLNDVVSGDDVSFATGITGAFADKNVGTNKTVTYSGIVLTGNDKNNYSIAETATGKGTITPKALTATFADITKVYDGTTDATPGLGTLSGVETVDSGKVSVSASAAYDQKNAGSRIVNYSGVALSGDEAANYSIATTTTGAGTITPKTIAATFADISKVYDGTTSATAGTGMLSGVETADEGKVNVSASAAYDEKNVGNRTVNYTGVALSGTEAGNYSIATSATGSGTITPKAITATFADISKTYDGTTNATPGLGTLSGVETVDSEKVSVSASAAYDEKNAGSRVVNYSGVALSGAEAGNYSIATTTTGAGTITPKALTATFADISKTYDGTTNATPGAGTLSGVIAADEGKVNVSASAAYDDKNAGSRVVNYTGVTLSGAEANNYSIATTATGNGSISRKALELVADSVSIQEGDSIPASFTGSVTGFAAGEGLGSGDTLLFTLADLSTTAAGSYGITGTINGSASGNYGLNYTFSNAASNANAFVIYDRPASMQDMVLSDIIPGIKGTPGADISVMALDNSLEQATDKKAEAGIEFAVAQTILSVDADRNLSLENQGMKQPPAMTPQEVAEQVHAQQGNGNGVAAQSGGNADAASVGANENGAASNMGVAGAVNAAMDVVQQADNAVGTEESKRKKGVA